jgi:hypothetical protein
MSSNAQVAYVFLSAGPHFPPHELKQAHCTIHHRFVPIPTGITSAFNRIHMLTSYKELSATARGIFFQWDLHVEIVVKAQDLVFFLGTWCGTPVFEGTTPKG